MKQVFLTLAVCVLLPLSVCLPPASAAPVSDEPFRLRQPDGQMVEVRIWGDEFYQHVESLDGYTLLRDPKTGVICYAALSRDHRELVSTGVRAGAPQKTALGIARHLRVSPDAVGARVRGARARHWGGFAAKGFPRATPHEGSVLGLCLIVDFPDEPGTISPAEVDVFCNELGYTANGNNGSIRDYYRDVSNDRLDYTNFVLPAYYTALHDKSHYDDPAQPSVPGAVELITEALDYLDDTIDYAQFDADDDGFIDAINCFYVGTTSAGWSMGLWPHCAPLIYETDDDVMTIQYQITYMGSSLRIGTFCHENGHMLFWWPDLYDYDHDSRGLGQYCLMSGGNHVDGGRNPVEPCAYLKDRAGWTDTLTLTQPQQGLGATAGSDVIHKYPDPANENEYYLIDNRQQVGRDAGLPDAGLAIWHIDESGSNDWNQMTPERHYRVTLVQADGEWDLENDRNSGDATDLWSAPTFARCGPNTSPDTDWWDGPFFSYLDVRNISASGATMTFDFVGAGRDNEDADTDGISDWDEARDLEPGTPGVQNPFDPLDPDTTGDNGSDEPDGRPDGENDYDGDGTTNADESYWGGNPMDPTSHLPVASNAALLLLVVLMAVAMVGMSFRREAP